MNNYNDAEKFLRRIGGDSHVFQTYADPKKLRQKVKIEVPSGLMSNNLAKAMTSTLEDAKKTLEAKSSYGAGVFVQINEGERRGNKFIKRIRFVWVDIDSAEQSPQIMRALKEHMPRPSMLVQSSPGKYHVYWEVTDCPLDKFTFFQRQLAVQFATDGNVSDLSRVMRLPGFLHQKYEPQMVKLLMVTDDKYTLQELYDCASKAPTLTPVSKEGAALQEINSSDAFGLDLNPDYEAPTELLPGERTNKLVAHIGHMVGNGYSAEAIVTEIKRMNVELCPKGHDPIPEETLQAEVLDCVYRFVEERDIQAGTYTEARSNITRANMAPPPPPPPVGSPEGEQLPQRDVISQQEDGTLDAWLDRFRYIENGSRVIDTQLRAEHSEFTLQDFKNKTQNVRIGGKAPLSQKWLQSPERKSFRDTTFIPKADQVILDGKAQLWNMYRPTRLPMVSKEEFDESKLGAFMAHMEFMFPKKKDREYFFNWFATTVCKPELRVPWAPLIISKQGVGKGWIFQCLQQLVGTHNSIMIEPDRLESQFNSFLVDKTLVCIDEMKNSSKFGVSDRLKMYISEPAIEINQKGVKEMSMPVYCNMLIFTNNRSAAHIEENDRRFWVHEVKSKKQPDEYYVMLYEWLKSGDGPSHLLRWCHERDLTGYNSAAVPPKTLAKLDMQDASRNRFEQALRDAIEGREGPFQADVVAHATMLDYLRMTCNCDVSNDSILSRINYAWRDVSDMLEQAQSPIKPLDENATGKFRVRCIRNLGHWSKQTRKAVQWEMTRAIQMQLGHNKVLPPQMEAIKGDTVTKQTDNNA